MGINVSLSINAKVLSQIGLGGLALAGGYKASSEIVRSAFRNDLLNDPTRVVEIDDRTMIYQVREAQGGRLTNTMLAAGAASAFAGSVLTLGTPVGQSSIKSLARAFGGTGLFFLGLGAIAGATATSAQYRGTDFRPIR